MDYPSWFVIININCECDIFWQTFLTISFSPAVITRIASCNPVCYFFWAWSMLLPIKKWQKCYGSSLIIAIYCHFLYKVELDVNRHVRFMITQTIWTLSIYLRNDYLLYTQKNPINNKWAHRRLFIGKVYQLIHSE